MKEERRNLIQVSATKMASEKVASMVATFLNEDSNGSQIIKVPTTKTEPENVANTVATFLTDNSV